MADRSRQTEKATPRRLEKAREEGQFPVSKEFVAAVQFLAFITILSSYGKGWLAAMTAATRMLFERAFRSELTATEIRTLLQLLTWRIGLPLLAGGAVLVAVSLAAHFSITRFGFSLKKLAPDFKRLSPGKNLTNLLRHNLPQFVQALIFLPLFCFAVYGIASENVLAYLRLPFQAVESGIQQVFVSVQDLLWKAASLFLLWGAIDLFRQKRRFAKDVRMSKQDLRDETKHSEGNPQVKSRIRRLQRDLLRRRMMSQVPTATAVIVNPTHYAVAIRYHVDSMAAPVVIAKGKNYLALRIRQKAIEHLVPIVENPPLAQALYGAVEVGQEIPANFYRAVAEILAYIYKIRNARKTRVSERT